MTSLGKCAEKTRRPSEPASNRSPFKDRAAPGFSLDGSITVASWQVYRGILRWIELQPLLRLSCSIETKHADLIWHRDVGGTHRQTDFSALATAATD
jgi:hypothetical protein